MSDQPQRAALDECVARHETWLATNGAEGERLNIGSAGPALVDWSETDLSERWVPVPGWLVARGHLASDRPVLSKERAWRREHR